MGACWGRVRGRARGRRRVLLLLVGLDNAGKTQTASSLAGEGARPLPTVGFKAVNLIHRDTPVTIYDLGGGPQFRQIWPQYYSEVHGIIFVIDSSDFSRLEECKNVLEEVLSHDKISGKPVLILANKQDKRGALDDIDVVEKLNIEPLVNRYRCPTLVESYTATVSDDSKKRKLDPGLKKGYFWLLNYIINRYGDINLRVQTDIHSELERRKYQSAANESRTSRTFTAESHDDIMTQTGFENPNYQTLTRHSTLESEADRIQSLEEGVIIVKPITYKSSEENTITVESVEENESLSSDVKPKLSPLFGRLSDHGALVPNGSRIQLETRDELSKLSPVLRVKNMSALVRRTTDFKSHVNSNEFKSRPHSSPSIKAGVKKVVDIIEMVEEGRSNSTQFVDVHLGDTRTDMSRNHVTHVEWNLCTKQAELVITDKNEPSNKVTTSDSGLHTAGSRTLPAEVRPASASQLVRKQLEIVGGASHRRRLSLRYGHRNKTSPEKLGLFHYEPGSGPKHPGGPARQMDKGDFEAGSQPNYMTQHGDLTL